MSKNESNHSKRSSNDNNAFSYLMTSAKRGKHSTNSNRKLSSESRFVACPAGCGKHVLAETINAHLDICMKRSRAAAAILNDQAVTVTVHDSQTQGCCNSQCSDSALPSPDDKMQEVEHAATTTSSASIGNSTMTSPVTTGGSPASDSVAFSPSKMTMDCDRCCDSDDDDAMLSHDEPSPAPSFLTASTQTSLATQPLPRVSLDGAERGLPTQALPSNAASLTQECSQTIDTQTVSASEEDATQPSVSDTLTKPQSNVFTQMMQRSKKVFGGKRGAPSLQPIQQHFYLHQDGTVSLATSASHDTDQQQPYWSAQVLLRNNSFKTQHKRPINLELASFCCGDTRSIGRLVQKHSSLSVSVLKSMLQKAVRKQRPLAAVKIAMELADKAMGELLRRLPIIVLEDATLHPDFGLLVWLVMAESKGFVVTKALMERVLRIIYQVACCSFKDIVGSDGENATAGANSNNTTTSETNLAVATSRLDHVSLDGLNTTDWNNSLSSTDQTLVWSILARAEYGGMLCDVQMLHQYANVWANRFASRTALSGELQIKVDAESTAPLTWTNVPRAVHPSNIINLSVQKVSDFVAPGATPKLRLPDVCVEGVDFHCSPILDHLLANDRLFGVCADLLRLSGETLCPSEDRTRVEGFLKKCMWDYSAGVNHRRPLIVDGEATSGEGGAVAKERSAIWKDLYEANVRRYQIQYVKHRLA
ncbi:hypothetical protein MPSEU_001076000 [Mayamaea pseudoterrestris]|nr:hypothetical protein MPSEU_001076000 [Mayamaea pseudoterrestris]